MQKIIKYPIGEQSFENVREGDYVYADKTTFFRPLILEGGRYYFLSRPRRFGKSLFLSTLKCFFEGKRELFKGLYADTMDWDWAVHPVLVIDLNIESYRTRKDMFYVIDNLLNIWEKKYHVEERSESLSVRFSNVMRRAHEVTGQKVVVLVDEYDKPLVNNLHDQEMLDYYRDELAALYGNLKTNAEHIRFVFLTGVSRFAKLSVFSGLNNLEDISFSNTYSDICGLTEEELNRYFEGGIERLGSVLNLDYEGTIRKLKFYFDGYHFSPYGKDIYNPFSLINTLKKQEISNYWIQSGMPTLLAEQMKKFDYDVDNLYDITCNLDQINGLDLTLTSPTALLYQTGYLTITHYEPELEMFTLGMPNREVESGFMSFLLPYYSNVQQNQQKSLIFTLIRYIKGGESEKFMTELQLLFGSVSYDMAMQREQNLHNAMLILFKLLGLYVETEYRTSSGRIDIMITTEKYRYIIEIKLDGSAQEALNQIKDKRYAEPFSKHGRSLILIGANFDSKTRTLNEWLIESL